MDLGSKLRLLKELEKQEKREAPCPQAKGKTARPELLEFDFPGELEIGKHPLESHNNLNCALLAALTGTAPITDCSPDELLYWDTETTGLGGSGMLVFLIGTLRITRKGAFIKQYLLPEPATESEYLEMVVRELEDCKALVSYNGRAFDSHAIRTRCIMNRRTEPEQRPHLDLIYPARNAYRQTLEDCTLKRIEREILSIHRPPGDIPGALIPAQYAAWLESRDRQLLEPILEHNRYDLLSLAMLSLELTQTVTDRPESLPPRGLALLAQKMERSGDTINSLSLLEKAFEYSKLVDDKLRIGLRLKRLYLETGKLDTLRSHLERLYMETGRDPRAAVEWAKQLEHRDRDFKKAREVVIEALDTTEDKRQREELQHRLKRLQRKNNQSRSGKLHGR